MISINGNLRNAYHRIIIYLIVVIIATIGFSLWLDAFHIFWWLGISEPFNYTGIYGRPDHSDNIFFLYAVVFASGLTAFTIGWFRSMVI